MTATTSAIRLCLRPLTAMIFLAASHVGCSSNGPDQPAARVKSCAELAKCCERAWGTEKTLCTTALSTKDETACGAIFDRSCSTDSNGTLLADAGWMGEGGSGGGTTQTDSGPMPTSAPLDVCTAHCGMIAALRCGDDGPETECVTACVTRAQGSCAAPMVAMLQCLLKGPYLCAEGVAQPSTARAKACEAQVKAAVDCAPPTS
jgi:hypothetical protein